MNVSVTLIYGASLHQLKTTLSEDSAQGSKIFK